MTNAVRFPQVFGKNRTNTCFSYDHGTCSMFVRTYEQTLRTSDSTNRRQARTVTGARGCAAPSRILSAPSEKISSFQKKMY